MDALQFWGLLGGWALTICGLVWTAAKVATANSKDIGAHSEDLKDHEKRIRVLEENGRQIASMRQDIQWIREAIARNT